nr:fibronectin type III domain-containing protein [Bacteroidota bacterium]
MRTMIVCTVLFMSYFIANAQNQKRNRISVLIENEKIRNTFRSTTLFGVVPYQKVNEYAEQALALELNKAEVAKLLSEKNYALNISVPMADGSTAQLEMVQSNIGKFDVTEANATGTKNINYTGGLHYQGIMKGDFSSIATASIFNDKVYILFANDKGSFNLGQLEDNSGYYILFNDKNLKFGNPNNCLTPDNIEYDNKNYSIEKKGGSNSILANCKIVKCYYEADFAMYQAYGSNTTTTANYVTAIHNQKAILYANDGVTIETSQIVVWTTTDPYASNTTTSTTNAAFITQTGANFNGDIASLLTTRSLGGGIAQGFSGLCNKSQAHCTSQIYTTYSNVPVYSWTVMVITHEMGHLMGLRHTHACVWNGNNTAIDGCSGATEGGCPLPGYHVNGGTIMSYCHIQSVGINLSLGFGPQPTAVLVAGVAAATCLTGSSATTPTGLTTTNVGANSATLSWNSSLGATDYNVEYKASTSTVWIPLGTFQTTTAPLSGLNANTTYNWRVNADCSAFSTAVNFTTTGLIGCDIAQGLNATNITSTTAKLNWTPWSLAVTYRIRYRPTGTTVWTIKSSSVSNKNITGLLPSTTYQWQVSTKCGTVLKPYSASSTFTTQSIAPPTTYCASNGANTTYEYITNVTFGSINNTSGNNSGYGNYTSLISNAVKATTYTLSVTLSKSVATDNEFVTAWIDYNRDGDFDDAGEQVYAGNSTANTFTGNVLIPNTFSVGQTRMRVSMQFNAAPLTCGAYTYGEVEDYILNLKTAGPPPRESAEFISDIEVTVSPNPVSDNLQITIGEEFENNLGIQVLDITGKVCINNTLATDGILNVNTLSPGLYLLKIFNGSENISISRLVKK